MQNMHSSEEEKKAHTERHIAILGGSFDPPTISHLQIASEVLNTCRIIDEVWLIPCGDRPDKKLITPPADRLEMVQIAASDFFPTKLPIRVDDTEVRNGPSIPTYFLMKQLEKEHPEDTFYFILGSDILPTLYTWDEGQKLIDDINYIIVQREHYEVDLRTREFPVPKKYIAMVKENVLGGVSSTELRRRIRDARTDGDPRAAACCNIAGLTTKGVINYIVKHGLYSTL